MLAIEMKSALITGVTGQDGLYLAELLLDKGYRIIGAVRDVFSAKRKIPAHLKIVELVEWDMLDQQKMIAVLSHYRPTEIYNFAAHSSGTVSYTHLTLPTNREV